VPSACPGGRAPHTWLDEDRSLYDAFGQEFTLLRLAGAGGSNDLEKAAASAGLPLQILDVPGEDIRDLYEADMTLIRPDQSVAWRGNKIDDPEGIIDTVRGAG